MNRHDMDQDEINDAKWEYRFERFDEASLGDCHLCGEPLANCSTTSRDEETVHTRCHNRAVELAEEMAAEFDDAAPRLEAIAKGPQQAGLFPAKEVA
jgi:hypothetical protein